MNECKPHARTRVETLPSSAEFGQEAQLVVAQVGRNLAGSAGNVQEAAGDLRETWRCLTEESGRDGNHPRGVAHCKPCGTE
jgi:hypothetical protein